MNTNNLINILLLLLRTLHEQRNAQLVADAYYILSDSTQRAQYDSLRSARDARERSTDPGSSANFFANFANMFAGTGTGSSAGAGAGAGVPPPQRPDAEGVFGDVFEDVRCFLSFLCRTLS